MGIAGRKALVTGGASGFGFEIARRLICEGMDVAILDVRNQEEAARRLGRGVLPLQADVGCGEEIKAALERCVRRFGGLDTLVLSAGVMQFKALQDVTEAEWDEIIKVNLKGAFLVSQNAAPYLRDSHRGRIVAISSEAGKRGIARAQAYCASKAGLIGLARSLAVELAPHVTVNCVCPSGCPTTGMGKRIVSMAAKETGMSPDSIAAAAARANPLGRNATEADVADAALFFISEKGSFLTGTALDVDGGARMSLMPAI